MDVLIIPEDPRLDQHILKPVVERIFADLKVPANIRVLQDPRMRGVSQALDENVIQPVVDLYPMVDLFLVIVDRDCDRESNVARARTLESRIPDRLIVCLAIEEVETWMLYLHRDALGRELSAGFREVRASCDPKDEFAEPLLRKLGWTTTVGKGRKRAMRDLGASWSGLLRVCDELSEFRARIAEVVGEVRG